MRLKKREEIWKVIPGYSRYAVSNMGRIKRLTTFYGKHSERILNPVLNSNGYLFVMIRKDGETKRNYRPVHRIVLETFIGPCPEGHCGHHKNEKKTDNFLSNIEYVLRIKHERIHKQGKGLSKEHRRKIGEKSKGRVPANKGKFASEETKQKLREACIKNGNRKLTDLDIKEIRRIYIPRKITCKIIANKYNVTPGYIGEIIRKKCR